MIPTTLALATVAPVLALLAIILAVVDHLRAPEQDDWWFVAALAALVIGAIPFSPFGFDYDTRDNDWIWRLVTCSIVVLPVLLLHVVAHVTGLSRRAARLRIPDAVAVGLVVLLLAMPTFPGPSYEPAPLYYSLAFGVFALLWTYTIAIAIALLLRAIRGARGPARTRGVMLLGSFALFGLVTLAWLLVPSESTELWWSLVVFLASLPFWLALRAPRGVFQLLAREAANPADGIARLVRSEDVVADLPAALESTRLAWGLRSVEVRNADGGVVAHVGGASDIPDAAERRHVIHGIPGGMHLVLHADTLSPTIRPDDQALLELLASSIQLAFDRHDTASRTHAAAVVSGAASDAIEEAGDRVRDAEARTTRTIAMVAEALHEPAAALVGLASPSESRWSELPPEDLRPLQQLVARRVERIATTVQQLLLASSVEHGTLLAGPERFDLRDVLLAAARAADLEHDLRIEDPDDPDCCIVESDPLALRHVLTALIDNAMLHGAAPVQLEVRRVDGHVLVAVIDHGAGVRDSFARSLYEPFTRDGAAGAPGVGLGLSIARELSDAVGATIDYRRDRGRTVFELRVPVTPARRKARSTSSRR